MSTIMVDEREIDAAIEARKSAERETERAEIRRSLAAQKAREAAEKSQARRKKAMDDAEAMVMATPPVITFEYSGVRVVIKLVGGRDHLVRMTVEEGIRRVVRVLQQRLLDDIGAARAGEKKDGKALDHRLMLRLTEELRDAKRFGAVVIGQG